MNFKYLHFYLFLLLLSHFYVTLSLQCFQSNFPKVIGGLLGDSSIQTFDFDGSLNLVVGGGSSDTSLMSGGSVPNPFIAYFESDGDYKWAKQIGPTTYNNIMSIQFNSAGTKIIGVLDASNLYIIVLDQNGNLIYSFYSFSYTAVTFNGAQLFDSSDYLYLGLEVSSTFGIMKVYVGSSPITANWVTSTGIGSAQGLTFAESESYIYSCGMAVSVVFPFPNYNVLTRIAVSSMTSPTVSWNYGHSNTAAAVNYFYLRRLYHTAFSGTNYVFGCHEGEGTLNKQIAVSKFTLSGTYTVSSDATYSIPAAATQAYCHGVYAGDANNAYMVISYASGNSYFVNVVFSGPTATQSLISSISDTNSQLYEAHFVSATSVYYGGYVKVINGASPAQSYTYKAGIVMTYSNTDSALTLSYTPTSITPTSVLSFGSATLPSGSYVFLLPTAGLTVTSFLTELETNGISNTWANPTTFTFTASSIPATAYIIKVGSTQLITFSAFTLSSPATCTDAVVTYTAKKTSDNSAIPSYITLNAASTRFEVVSTSNSDVSVTSITLVGTLPNGEFASTAFDLTMIHSCTYATVAVSANTASFTYNIRNTALQYTFAAFTTNDTDCTLAYTMTLSDYTAYDTSFLTFTPASRLMAIETSDPAKAQTYNLKLKAAIVGYTNSAELDFTITLVDICLTTVITSDDITPNPYIYDIYTNILETIATLGWTQSIAYCPTITYALTNADNSPADGIVTLTSGVVKVQTALVAKVTDYYLKIVGTVAGYTTATELFTLSVIYSCATLVITPSSLSDTPYTIKGTQVDIPYSDWGVDVTNCDTFTYSALLSGGGALPSFIVLDTVAQQFEIVSTSNADVGVYDIVFKGLNANGQFAYDYFRITASSSCTVATITATANTASFSYDIQTSALTHTFNVFTIDDSDCSITYSLTLSDGSPIDSSFITFTPASRQMVVSTSDVAKATTYNLRLVGTVTGFTPTTFHAFTLVLNDACLGTVITQSAITNPSTYDIQSGLLSTIATLAFTQSVSYCGSITYVLQNQDTSAVDSIITLVSGNIVKVQTSLPAKVDDYYLQVIATVAGYATLTVDFTLTVFDSCDATVITQSAITDPSTYDIHSGLLSTIATLAFTQSVSYCGSITYVLQNQDTTPVDSIITLVSGNIVKVQTSLTAKVDDYYLQVIATVAGYATLTVDFTLTVTDSCTSTVLTQSAIPDPYVYDINSGNLALIATLAFTQSIAYCGTITYTLQDQSGSAADSIVSLVSSNLVKVQTSLVAKVGFYYLEVIGEVAGYDTLSVDFTLEVTDVCALAGFTPPAINDEIYVIGATAKQIPFGDFTSDNPDCEVFTYTAQLSTGSPLPSHIVFSSLLQKFTVYTLDTSDAASLEIEITATLPSGQFTQQYFTIELQDPCLGAVLTPSTIADLAYQVDGSDYTQFLPVFTSSLSTAVCGDIAYTLTDQVDVDIDSAVFTFDPTALSLQVETVLTSIGSYDMKLTGSLEDYPTVTAFTLFDLTIYNECMNFMIYQPATLRIFYIIGKKAKIVNIKQFYVEPEACVPTYELTFTNGSAIDPDLFQFQYYDLGLRIYSDNYMKLGNYSLTLKGSREGKHQDKTILVQVETGCLYDQVISVMVPNQVYTLNDGLKTFMNREWINLNSLCPIKIQYIATMQNGNSFPNFISFNSTERMFSVFTNSTADVGEYSIKLMGYFYPYQMIDQEIVFTLTVIDPDLPFINSTLNQTKDHDHDEDDFDLDFLNGNLDENGVLKVNGLSAVISSISNSGMVTIKFNQNMQRISNYTLIDHGITMEITNQKTELIKNWTTTYMNDNSLQILLRFVNPNLIGNSWEKDYLTVNVKNKNIFFNKERTTYLPVKYRIRKSLPLQFNSLDDMNSKSAELLSNVVKTGIAVITTLSLTLQLVISGTLSIWGLVNSLQLLIYIPLLNIPIPPNLLAFISNIQSLLNLEFLNLDEFYEKFLQLTTDPEDAFNERFTLMGFQSKYFINNMGLSMISIVIYIAILIVNIIFNLLRLDALLAITKKLQRMVKYSGLFRFLIESTLEILISVFIQVNLQTFNTLNDYASLAVGGLLTASLIALSVFQIFFLRRNQAILQEEETLSKFEALYEGLKTFEKPFLYFPSFFFIRRFGFILLVFLANSVPGLQVLTFVFLNLICIGYVCFSQPFEESSRFYMEFLNEVCHMAASILMIGLTDMIDSDDQNFASGIGWAYIFILVFNVIVNVILVGYSMIIAIKKILSRRKNAQKKRQRVTDGKTLENIHVLSKFNGEIKFHKDTMRLKLNDKEREKLDTINEDIEELQEDQSKVKQIEEIRDRNRYQRIQSKFKTKESGDKLDNFSSATTLQSSFKKPEFQKIYLKSESINEIQTIDPSNQNSQTNLRHYQAKTQNDESIIQNAQNIPQNMQLIGKNIQQNIQHIQQRTQESQQNIQSSHVKALSSLPTSYNSSSNVQSIEQNLQQNPPRLQNSETRIQNNNLPNLQNPQQNILNNYSRGYAKDQNAQGYQQISLNSNFKNYINNSIVQNSSTTAQILQQNYQKNLPQTQSSDTRIQTNNTNLQMSQQNINNNSSIEQNLKYTVQGPSPNIQNNTSIIQPNYPTAQNSQTNIQNLQSNFQNNIQRSQNSDTRIQNNGSSIQIVSPNIQSDYSRVQNIQKTVSNFENEYPNIQIVKSQQSRKEPTNSKTNSHVSTDSLLTPDVGYQNNFLRQGQAYLRPQNIMDSISPKSQAVPTLNSPLYTRHGIKLKKSSDDNLILEEIKEPPQLVKTLQSQTIPMNYPYQRQQLSQQATNGRHISTLQYERGSARGDSTNLNRIARINPSYYDRGSENNLISVINKVSLLDSHRFNNDDNDQKNNTQGGLLRNASLKSDLIQSAREEQEHRNVTFSKFRIAPLKH